MQTDSKRRGTARPWLWTVVIVFAGGQSASGEVALGRSLWVGTRPLAAHVAGQDFELPQDAAVCTNCHQSGPASASTAASPVSLAQPFGPPLTRTTLSQPRGRRGGPPSVYDSAKLCRALRDGIDPALVVIPQTMPRYAFTDQQCQALWAFLSTRS
jgi:hypothetical protein